MHLAKELKSTILEVYLNPIPIVRFLNYQAEFVRLPSGISITR